MRRLLMLILLFAGLTLPAACGGGGKAFAFPTVSSSELGVDPTVVSDTSPPEDTMIKVLKEGTGHPVAAHDYLVADAKGQVWSDGGVAVNPFVNTFSGHHLLFQPIDQTVPGWSKVLPGVKVGSRLLIINPPKDGFGPDGNLGIGVSKDDSLIWVIDVIDSMPLDSVATGKAVDVADGTGSLPSVTAGRNPTVTVPKVAAPQTLVVRQLLAGMGPKVAAGQVILAQYTGVIWKDNRVFDTSWKEGRGPFSARLAVTDQVTGEPGVIKGWAQGIPGARVGSRILLIVPPKFGYKKAGSPSAGITGTDTLVFVVDILGVYKDPTKLSPGGPAKS